MPSAPLKTEVAPNSVGGEEFLAQQCSQINWPKVVASVGTALVNAAKPVVTKLLPKLGSSLANAATKLCNSSSSAPKVDPLPNQPPKNPLEIPTLPTVPLQPIKRTVVGGQGTDWGAEDPIEYPQPFNKKRLSAWKRRSAQPASLQPALPGVPPRIRV